MKIDIKDWVNGGLKPELKDKIDNYSLVRRPRLLIIQIGDLPQSNAYVKGKLADAQEVGISASLFKVSADERAAFETVHNFLKKNVESYDGVILQEPSGFTDGQRQTLLELIGADKDVDGFLPNSNFQPCTPKGIMRVIKSYWGEPNGATAVVVGRGALVGFPLSAMLIKEGFTTIVCNSKTPDLKEKTLQGDIVISAVGKRNLITKDMVKPGALVIDAGIDFDENGKICGDCDKAMYADDFDAGVTPVPGGVGLMTRYELMENVAWRFLT